jgi:hypothetical protein
MSKKFLILFIGTISWVLQATPNCPQGHCAKVSAAMNKYCMSIGQAGKMFMVFGPNGEECFCPCSCVTPDTSINLAFEAKFIHELEINDNLHTPMSNVNIGRLHKKMRSEIINGQILSLTFDNGSIIRSSTNHTYITPEEQVITAEQLEIGNTVLDKNLKSVSLIKKEIINEYEGELLNFIINETSSKAEDHVISNNNILSGDWLLQTNNDSIEKGIEIRSGNIDIYQD